MTSKYRSGQARTLRWAQGSVCAACGGHLPSAKRLKRFHPDYPTFDHVLPRSKGGGRTLHNGLLKHHRCNMARRNLPPTGCDLIWLEFIRARLAVKPQTVKGLAGWESVSHRGSSKLGK